MPGASVAQDVRHRFAQRQGQADSGRDRKLGQIALDLDLDSGRAARASCAFHLAAQPLGAVAHNGGTNLSKRLATDALDIPHLDCRSGRLARQGQWSPLAGP